MAATGIITEACLANVMAAWNAYAYRPRYFQVGSGTGQSSVDDDLAVPLQDRILGSTAQETTNVMGDTLRLTGSITAETDISVTEMGVFDAATNGSLDIYGYGFPDIDLAAGDTVVFSVGVVVS